MTPRGSRHALTTNPRPLRRSQPQNPGTHPSLPAAGGHRAGCGAPRASRNPRLGPPPRLALSDSLPKGLPTRPAAGTPPRPLLLSQRPPSNGRPARPRDSLRRLARPASVPTCWSHSGHDLVAIFTFLARVADMLLSPWTAAEVAAVAVAALAAAAAAARAPPLVPQRPGLCPPRLLPRHRRPDSGSGGIAHACAHSRKACVPRGGAGRGGGRRRAAGCGPGAPHGRDARSPRQLAPHCPPTLGLPGSSGEETAWTARRGDDHAFSRSGGLCGGVAWAGLDSKGKAA